MITQEALNIKKRLGYIKSSLFFIFIINKMTNKTYKVQEIFNWFKQFHKEEIKKLLLSMTREQKNQEKKILLFLRKQKRILKIMRDKQTAWLIIFL